MYLIEVGHVLLRVLSSSHMSSLALQKALSVLVELQIGDLDLGGINTDLRRGSVHLLTGDSLDVDDPLLSVDLRHLSLLTLVGATSHLHLIALDDRDGVDLEMTRSHESSRCTYPSEPCSEEKTSSDGGCEKEPRNEPYGKYGEKKKRKDYTRVRTHRSTEQTRRRISNPGNNPSIVSHVPRGATRIVISHFHILELHYSTMNWYINSL